MPSVPEASSILASLGQAAFLWDLIADTIAWSDNAGTVFTDIPAEALASGAGFAGLIEPSRSIRNEALAQSGPARGGEGIGGGSAIRAHRIRPLMGCPSFHRPAVKRGRPSET